MGDLWRLVWRLLTKWQSYMSCSVITIIGYLTALHNKDNAWIVHSLKISSIAFLLLALVMLVVEESTKRRAAEAKLKLIEDAKPKIVLCGTMIERITFHDRFTRQPIFTGDFVKMRFLNDPKDTYAGSVAQGVRIKIKFLDSAGSLLIGNMDGRWDSTDEPSTREPGTSKNDLLAMKFGIQEAQNIDLAVRNEAGEFIAFNSDSYNYAPGFKKPGHELGKGPVTAIIRLVGVDVDETFTVYFGTAPDGSVYIREESLLGD
jgi:hypothetical protein